MVNVLKQGFAPCRRFEAIRSAGRETTIVVAFTNTAEIKSVSLENLGQVSQDSQVATVEL